MAMCLATFPSSVYCGLLFTFRKINVLKPIIATCSLNYQFAWCFLSAVRISERQRHVTYKTANIPWKGNNCISMTLEISVNWHHFLFTLFILSTTRTLTEFYSIQWHISSLRPSTAVDELDMLDSFGDHVGRCRKKLVDKQYSTWWVKESNIVGFLYLSFILCPLSWALYLGSKHMLLPWAARDQYFFASFVSSLSRGSQWWFIAAFPCFDFRISHFR